MISLPQLIQSHRKKSGLTQVQLAQLAGVGKTVVWDLEHGKESVQWDTLQKILRVLNITIEWQSPLLKRAAMMADSGTRSAPPFISPKPAAPSRAVKRSRSK